jgi:hypothetical protein
MRTNQHTWLSTIQGIVLACLISVLLWLLIALFLRGKTPIW